ncbi:MAG: class I SAM-dependent methyltransferase [Acidobacteria bacterium]|nr:class I SAM-dependent methyltransferase [Acidobacteriota bacterium]MCA1639921.1 class I SAM-dependent methyltransferase [Acidobacteriota bacterium]
MSEQISNFDYKNIFPELYDLAFSWDISEEISSLYFIWNSSNISPKFICEIGAGTGRFTIPLLQAGYNVTAIEPDSGMVRVLFKKINSQNKETNLHFNLIQDRIENTNLKDKFDSLIAMTDTLSYIWSLKNAKKFLSNAYDLLKYKGVLILDTSLWQEFQDSAREESWVTASKTGQIFAKCKTKLILNNNGFKGFGSRIEDLSFWGYINNTKVIASRRNILNSFSFQFLKDLAMKIGFNYNFCIFPGNKDFVEDPEFYQRLLLVFNKM